MPDVWDLLTPESEELDQVRFQDMRDHWREYEADHDDPLPVQVTPQGVQIDDNVIANLGSNMIDRSVSFLFGNELTFGLDVPETENLAEGVQARAETTMERVWKRSKKMSLLHDLGVNGGVTGHAVLRILYDPMMNIPRLINIDPQTFTCYWNPDDLDDVWGYKVQYRTMYGRTPVARRQVFEKLETGSWLIWDQISQGQGSAWQDLEDPLPWPYPFAPIVDTKNLPAPNEYYGKSDFDGGVSEMQKAINSILSNMNRLLRLFGHPRTWTSGVSPDQIISLLQGMDRIITLPPETTLNQIEMTGEPLAWIEAFARVKQLYHDIAKSPQVDPEKIGAVGGLSGRALEILYQPALEKNDTKRRLYGDLLTETNRRILSLLNVMQIDIEAEGPDVLVNWQEPIPHDPVEDATLAVQWDTLGVSQRTILERLGFDPDLEQQRKEEEQANQPQAPPTDLGGLLDSEAFAAGAGA